MDPTKVLTTQDVQDGIDAALDLRRAVIRFGLTMAAVMAGCGFVLIGIAYSKSGGVTWWALLLPAGLTAVIIPGPIREAMRLNRILATFRSAQREIGSGGTMLAQDIFPAGGSGLPNPSFKPTTSARLNSRR